MLLRDLSLGLNRDEYERIYVSDFQFRSRYLCHFVRRKIAPLRFQTNGFRAIFVQGCETLRDLCEIQGQNVAVAPVLFEKSRYESLDQNDLHEFFISMLLTGISTCAKEYEVPLVAIHSAVDEFRQRNYQNRWIFKKKLLRPHGIRASLICTMDSERFVLKLKLERKGAFVFEEPILETMPDETIFGYQFKDVVVEGDSVIVRDKFDKPTFSLKLSMLA